MMAAWVPSTSMHACINDVLAGIVQPFLSGLTITHGARIATSVPQTSWQSRGRLETYHAMQRRYRTDAMLCCVL